MQRLVPGWTFNLNHYHEILLLSSEILFLLLTFSNSAPKYELWILPLDHFVLFMYLNYSHTVKSTMAFSKIPLGLFEPFELTFCYNL